MGLHRRAGVSHGYGGQIVIHKVFACEVNVCLSASDMLFGKGQLGQHGISRDAAVTDKAEFDLSVVVLDVGHHHTGPTGGDGSTAETGSVIGNGEITGGQRRLALSLHAKQRGVEFVLCYLQGDHRQHRSLLHAFQRNGGSGADSLHGGAVLVINALGLQHHQGGIIRVLQSPEAHGHQRIEGIRNAVRCQNRRLYIARCIGIYRVDRAFSPS